MLLTITTTSSPASDLGFLLGKHPDRAQRFDLAWGHAHVFYPEANDARCTVAPCWRSTPSVSPRPRAATDPTRPT